MFQIVFTIILMPLFMVNSKLLDPFEIKTIVDFAKETVNTEIDNLKFLNSNSALSDALKRMRQTVQNIETFTQNSSSIDYFFKMIKSYQKYETDKTTSAHIDEELQNLNEQIKKIDKLYDECKDFSNNTTSLNDDKFKNWISATTENGELLETLDKVYSLIIEPKSLRNSSYLYRISKNISEVSVENQCGYKMSIQQRLHYFFQILMRYQIEGFIMNLYGNTFKAINTKSTDKSAYDKAEARVVLSIAESMLAIRIAMSNISTKVETCDAKIRTPETYTSFSQFLQDIVINVSDIQGTEQCTTICEDVRWRRTNTCTNQTNYCAKRPCRGHLNNCKTINSVAICEMPADYERRYLWYQSFEGSPYGHVGKKCESNGVSGMRQIAKNFAKDKWECSVCACVCTEIDKDSPAIRSISFRPQIAKIHNNMVVAGIRIIEANQMIQLQIKEGKLLSNGRIDPSTVAWKETEEMRYDANVTGGSFDYHDRGKSRWRKMKRGTDFAFVDGIDKYLNLDEISVDDGWVMTGVRWNHAPYRKPFLGSKILQIEFLATKYDYKTGILDTLEVKWVTPQDIKKSQQYYNQRRKAYNTADLDDPLRAPISYTISNPNKELVFSASSHRKDVGQSTVPFFDTQPVETDPPIASVGFEIVIRQSGDFGAFIALRLIAVDLSKVWTIKLDDNDVFKYKNSFSGELPYNLDD